MDQNKAIVRQQAVMKSLGFYEGKLDGLWGPKTIEAKMKWEHSNRFAPAVPNHGMPFKARDMLPFGTKLDSDGFMTCDGLDKVMGQAQKEIKEARHAEQAAEREFAKDFVKANPAPAPAPESVPAPEADVHVATSANFVADEAVVTEAVVDAAKAD